MSNNVKKMLVLGVVWFACATASNVRHADAGWWHGYGCYTPCYSYAYYPSYSCWSYPTYSYWNYPAYSAWYYPTYNCAWGYPAYQNYYWGDAVPAGGSAIQTAPLQAPKDPPNVPTPDPNVNATTFVNPVSKVTDTGIGYIDVIVPADAKVFVNGYLTKTKGEIRKYQLNDLANGEEYPVEIRSEVMVDGKLVKQTQVIKLLAGEKMTVGFSSHLGDATDPALASNQ